MMGASTMSDFAMGSNGHCFFCLNRIMERQPPHNLSSPHKTQINSLQYLTRYLKMDLKKVFIEKGQVSPDLLDTVEKARLKVELCEDCRCLSETFSKIYRQLEKLELELGSTLSFIHGKLTSADATGKLRGLTSGINSNWNGLFDVLDVLRAEAIQKSFLKLSDTPRVKIQNLTNHEVKSMQVNNYNDMESSQLSDDSNSNFDSDTMTRYGEVGTQKEKTERHSCADDNSEPEKIMISNIKVVSRTTKNVVMTGKYSIDSETGKRKCKDCSKEFNSIAAFSKHYQTTHLKLRYKCVACNKLFSNNSNLRLHQRTSQSCSVKKSAPKFKCHLCEKSFSLKHNRMEHLEGVHYKSRKYACDLCEKKFNIKRLLTSHRRNVHRMGKTNDK